MKITTITKDNLEYFKNYITAEDEEFINLKAVYRLSEKFKNPFEEFLKKNNFTDFYLLDEHDNPQVWAAVEEIRFYKKT